MRLLYWNPCLHDPYAAGTHAREVLAALRRIPDLEVAAWPEHGQAPAHGNRPRPLTRLLPTWLVLARRICLRPPPRILPALDGPPPDAIVARPNSHLGVLRELKARYPGVILCAEINAMVSDEVGAFLPFRGRWARWEATAIRCADRIVVVSSWLRDRLAALGIDPARILVNPNGVNVKHFDPDCWHRSPDLLASWGVPADAFVFGYVGGMEKFRRLPLMVTKFAEFAATHPHCHLVLIGDGPERPLVERSIAVFPRRISKQIHLPGVVPYQNVPAAMACFDCGVFPFSNPYGSPQKLFEYLAMGLPVIGPDVPAVKEILPDRTYVFLARQDGPDLTGLLHDALTQSEPVHSFGRTGRHWVTSQYTWDHNANRLLTSLSPISAINYQPLIS